MSEQSSYWARSVLTRRAALRGAAALGGGISALGLAGCRGGGTPNKQPANSAKSSAPLDPAKGKQGGKIIIQQFDDPGGGLELLKIRNGGTYQFAGFTHDGLLEYRNGTPAHEGYDFTPQPNLAQAMPEQTDPQTYVFKLRPAKFHNGRAMTSEDVKYSFETYARDSAWKNDWPWLDKVETPDAQTAVVKSKFPYADALQGMAAKYSGMILCREHQESAEAEKKLLGSGPFLFVDYRPPVISSYKRNPEYHRQPYPYFDAIDFLEKSDIEKKIADFSAHQVHMTYYFPLEERDRVKKARPDAQLFTYLRGSDALFMRTDKPPFNDKRVRQALSMAIDRKALSQAVAQGEGEPDQTLSIAGKYFGFRKPSELGAAAKYWDYNPQAAKQLLQAAGVSLPMKFEVQHWNASVVSQKFVDNINLIEAQWRNAGIAEVKDTELTFGQATQTINIGNYQGAHWATNTIGYNPSPDLGSHLRNNFLWPPEGIKGPPTLNVGYVNNAQLNVLLEKQIGQFNKDERSKTLSQIEDILAEEQYRIEGVTTSYNFFGDPSVKNMQTPVSASNGALPYVKYWWFDKS